MPIPKTNSPLLGYNTNVRHSGKLFHIQTEDSGVNHPHVITHLFTEGTILATKRTSYAEAVGALDLENRVRELMKTQHKDMFVELRDGVHDEIASRIFGEKIGGDKQPDDDVDPSAALADGLLDRLSISPPQKERRVSVPPPPPPPSQQRVSVPPPIPREVAAASAAHSAQLSGKGIRPMKPAKVSASPGYRPPGPAGDSEDGEETRPAAMTEKRRAEGGVKVIAPHGVASAAPKPAFRPAPKPAPVGRAAPRSIFDTPDSKGQFGAQNITDKSLDDVIMSFLTDDEEEPPR